MIGALQTALSGLGAAAQRMQDSAVNIARAGTALSAPPPSDAATGGVPQNAPILPDVDLATEAINMSLAETAYKANAKMIAAADEQMDTLLDILDTDG